MQRNRTSYAETYFRGLVWFTLARWAAAVVAILICGILIVVMEVAPDEFNLVFYIFAGIIAASFIWSCGAVAVGIVRAVFSGRPGGPVPLLQGIVANPPGPWFSPDGSPLYRMTPAGWVPISSPIPVVRADGRKEPTFDRH